MKSILHARRSTRVVLLMALLGPVVSGCGSNLEEVLFQIASAAGRTYLDLAVTDAANNVAASFEQDEGALADDSDDADDDQDDNGDGDADGGGNGDGDDDMAPNGAELFATNCAACHGDDGAGGFAPDVSGFAADDLAIGLALSSHSSISLTDDELAAIAAFLGGGTAPAGGDATSGAQIFTVSGCAACHCDDASGGCALEAPALGGVGFTTLDDVLRGEGAHPGGKFELDEQDLTDLQSYLAGV